MVDDAKWDTLHAKFVSQLITFDNKKGAGLSHMSSPAERTNQHSKCALSWWSEWSDEVPEL